MKPARTRLVIAIISVVGVAAALLTLWFRQPSASTLFQQGVTALSQGKIVLAEQLQASLLKDPAAESFARALKGGVLTNSSRYAQALEVLDPSLAAGELREPVLVWVGECFVGLKLLGQAEACLRDAVVEFPNNEHAVRLLAIVYHDLGAMHPALKQLEQLEKLAPQDYRVPRMAGSIYLDFEQYESAVTQLRRALDLNPPNEVRTEIVVELARAFRKQLKYAEALEALQLIEPTVESLGEMALNQMGQGDLKAAAESLRTGKRLSRPSPQLVEAEAQLLFEQKQFPAAVVALRRLLAMQPHDHTAQYKIALALREAGSETESLAAMQRFEEMSALRTKLTELNDKANSNPYDEAVRSELAEVCDKLGRHDLAQDWRDAARAAREGGRMHIRTP